MADRRIPAMQVKKAIVPAGWVCLGVFIGVIATLFRPSRPAVPRPIASPPPQVSFQRPPDAFDWGEIGTLIAAGRLESDKYLIEKVPLKYVHIGAIELYFVVDRIFQALLGPKQALALYSPVTRSACDAGHGLGDRVPYDSISDRIRYGFLGDRARYNFLAERIRYSPYGSLTPDELLDVAKEIVPLLLGRKPSQHEVLSQCALLGPGPLPIMKQTIVDSRGTGRPLVSYYAKMGPWGDILLVCVSITYRGTIEVSFHPVYEAPRLYR
jgi:hypothetical protein